RGSAVRAAGSDFQPLNRRGWNQAKKKEMRGRSSRAALQPFRCQAFLALVSPGSRAEPGISRITLTCVLRSHQVFFSGERGPAIVDLRVRLCPQTLFLR